MIRVYVSLDKRVYSTAHRNIADCVPRDFNDPHSRNWKIIYFSILLIKVCFYFLIMEISIISKSYREF